MGGSPQQDHHIYFMRQAICQAQFGLGEVAPNPAVGCVLVDEENHLIAAGRTQKGGRPHAEAQALAQAGTAARGATAYVTLEPCAHYGETPPCAQALIDAGIKRVVIGCTDPDPRVAGKGVALLRAHNIAVVENCLRDECERLNRGFLLRVTQNRPMVTLKIATSKNGFMRTGDAKNSWITGKKARNFGHMLRALHDVIMVGAGTLRVDNPRLDCRLPGLAARSPLPVIVQGKTALPAQAYLLQENRAQIMRGTATDILDALAAQGITRILLEGGVALARHFIAADRVDQLYWFCAPHEVALSGQSDLHKMGLADLQKNATFTQTESRLCGDDNLSIWHRKA